MPTRTLIRTARRQFRTDDPGPHGGSDRKRGRPAGTTADGARTEGESDEVADRVAKYAASFDQTGEIGWIARPAV